MGITITAGKDFMDEKYQSLVSSLENHFFTDSYESRGDLNIIVKADSLIDLVLTLKTEWDFDFLSNITAVDYWPQQTPRFHVIYLLRSQGNNQLLTIRVPLEGEDPEVHTLEEVFPNANWYEREVLDLFGIKFENHSDPRRLIMPQEWEGHPLRKDYPLGYENVQFSFNKDAINERKPKAKN